MGVRPLSLLCGDDYVLRNALTTVYVWQLEIGWNQIDQYTYVELHTDRAKYEHVFSEQRTFM